jgi:hypothetical protein
MTTQLPDPDDVAHADITDAEDGVPKRTGTSKRQIAQSVGAALLGVQSSKNRKRDFQTGKPMHFIIGGVIGTLVFIGVIVLIVQVLLATA